MRVLASRQGERRAIQLPVTLRVGTGQSEEAVLENLSQHGCRLRVRPRALDVGRYVMVRIDGLEAFSGQVRWTIGSKLGVAFERPLHRAVLDHIAVQPASARGGVLAHGS